MDTVYIETTIIGHLASRIHRDPVVAARQATTHDWWANQAGRYQIYISQLVLDECSRR